jgi:hypothetical protein
MLLLVLVASFALAVWALIDAAIRPKMAFEAAGQNKVLWIVLPLLGIFFLGPLAGVLAAVYLAVIRPKVRAGPRY